MKGQACLSHYDPPESSKCKAKFPQLAADIASLSEILFRQIHYHGSNQTIARPPNRETAITFHSGLYLHVAQLIEAEHVFEGLVEHSLQGPLEHLGDAPGTFGTVW